MTDSPLDPTALAELIDAMDAELVETFLSEAHAMFGDLTQAAADREEDTFRRAAHSIKSNAQTFGATALTDQARALELGGIPDDAPARLATLQSTFDAAAAALRGAFDE